MALPLKERRQALRLCGAQAQTVHIPVLRPPGSAAWWDGRPGNAWPLRRWQLAACNAMQC